MLPALEQGDVRALHQTRVASRRLREVLPVLEIEPDVARRLNRRLRKVTQRLGGVRELDVLSQLAEELAASGRYDAQAVRKVATYVGDERKRARSRLLDKMPIGEWRRISDKLSRIGEGLSAGKPSRGWRWAIDARVTHRAVAFREALDEAGSLYVPKRLHAVRIALKKLRYASEVAVEAAGLKVGADLRALKKGQDILGRLHDIQVLVEHVRQLQASLGPREALLLRKLDTLMTALEDDCRRLHARFMHQRSGILAACDRVAGPRAAAVARRAAS